MNAAIKVENVSKLYKLYDKPIDRVKESLHINKKKYYKEHYALKNISFEITKGETVGIIGTNGSGKSTLLKIITGVLSPTEGKIFVDGRISALLELGAGFNPEYTGIENIYLNGTMLGFSKKEIEEKLDKIVKFADIGEFINQPIKTYSSGMFVRLAFAVAINIDPEILIVDEALSVGDVFFQAKCYKKFEDFKKAGKTILFVSHDLGSISKYCDRTMLINEGSLIAQGTSREMVDLYKKILVNQLEENGIEDNALCDKGIMKNWSTSVQINPEKIEYGNNKAKIIDFGIFDNSGKIGTTVIKGEEFSIKMRVTFYEKINNPIFAFTIKDIKGNDITGTNTMVEKIDTQYNNINDIIEVTFTQEMILQGGEYILSLGCTGYEQDQFVVYHRLYDICSISVLAEKSTVGFFDINSKINIKEINSVTWR